MPSFKFLRPVIMITGHAVSGKDTFFSLLKEIDPNFKRYAFADKLKQDLRLFLMEQCRIDINALSPEQKDLVRPLMIAYGCMMRNLGDGLYWVRELEKQILSDLDFEGNLGNPQMIPVITDCRFRNEAEYFKNRYQVILVRIIRKDSPEPPEEEKINQPLVQPLVDYTIDWPTVGPDHLHELKEYVEKFLKEVNFSEHLK